MSTNVLHDCLVGKKFTRDGRIWTVVEILKLLTGSVLATCKAPDREDIQIDANIVMSDVNSYDLKQARAHKLIGRQFSFGSAIWTIVRYDVLNVTFPVRATVTSIDNGIKENGFQESHAMEMVEFYEGGNKDSAGEKPPEEIQSPGERETDIEVHHLHTIKAMLMSSVPRRSK